MEVPAKFKGKEAFFNKMLLLFVKDLPVTWADFDTAVNDMENTKAFVHRIKGTAGNLGLDAVYQSAVALEATLRAGTPCKDLYDAFIKVCEETRT